MSKSLLSPLRFTISRPSPCSFSRPSRLFHSTPSLGAMQPRFSEGTDSTAVATKLEPLLAEAGGRWTLAADGQALERSFKFKTFTKTWDFMTAVALQCKMKNHHPEWSNAFNRTFIRWTTHQPQGLSEKDITLAAICDDIAKELGEQDPEPASADLKDLAAKEAANAAECCAPKKK